MRERLWYKLDNSAKIMPSMTNNINTNVFRITCTLNEKIDKEILQEALDLALIEFPLYSFTMKAGLFWHYLEQSNVSPKVEEDRFNPCSKLEGPLLFRVNYYKKRINLDVYHVLADGNGAMEFLKCIVTNYLQKKHNFECKVPINLASEYEKNSDDFAKFEKAKFKIQTQKDKRAYKLKFPRKSDAIHDCIEAHMKASEIKKNAKKYDTTVTIYLTAILIDSIIKCAKIKDLKKPIGIVIPADLRNIFPSKTSRNFFYTTLIQYQHEEEYTLTDIIVFLKKEFAEKLNPKNLQELLNSYMILEKFLIIRIIPRFIKDWVLRFITTISYQNQTMTLSNVGVIKLPEEYEPFIESFTGLMSSNALHLTTMTYKDTLVLGFTSHFISKEIERMMIKSLKEDGVGEVTIISNERGEISDKM